MKVVYLSSEKPAGLDGAMRKGLTSSSRMSADFARSDRGMSGCVQGGMDIVSSMRSPMAKAYAKLIHSSKSSSSFSSSGAAVRRHIPSAPECSRAGTWIRVKSNNKIPVIHQLIVALGCKSRLFIIPLIYFASTSMIRWRSPIR